MTDRLIRFATALAMVEVACVAGRLSGSIVYLELVENEASFVSDSLAAFGGAAVRM